jgi:hypothetical protein
MKLVYAGKRCAAIAILLMLSGSATLAQTSPRRTCLPISERAGRDVGCWLIVAEPVGRMPRSEVFWHLDTYLTRAAAEAAKGPRGAVVEALGKVWLFTIEEAGWRPSGGIRVAEVVRSSSRPANHTQLNTRRGSPILVM